MIKQVLRFQTTDNKLFDNYNLATKHQDDLLGEALDSLIPFDFGATSITRSDRHKMLMLMIDPNNRDNLTTIINELYHMLNTTHFKDLEEPESDW